MRHMIKGMFVIGLLASGSTHAFAQATTTQQPDQAPTAQDAFNKKDASHVSNPTEQNKTYPNQAKEQPQQGAPATPEAMAPTGQTSDKTPVAQKMKPRHVHTKHTAHKPG
ncbi:hypothetical protein AA101099_2208 [Neoasaia chiangmaiensis NBRC 101099]|uniref:Uncharacterized protein n=1 Tax=Neoasaia chiangmaiensis TaxID=320497 RepID=A0A1U9KSM4_9PROT|nr:hypothetical protein [Neoasaia chiangmaiensis]AQS88833.1 hypothetical protein A0U93_13885 [Neoasaia chiangmaiensis]GBR40642.1 hypothetical protein AA101099_2208 [Neoasaia chiangmaiensis NBRC 101099]GEN13804.1 hypothetical protein NCH01_02350 [Neoasaia chiangmaiensis]